MRRFTVVACVVLAGMSALAGPALPPEQLAWAPGLQAALEEAAKRKAPLLVVLNMDGERGNDRMVAEVYTAPAVRDAAKKVVATVASLGRHAEADDPAAGRKVCSRFGHVTCDEHRATEEVVRKDWLKCGPKDDVDSPRHIVVAPDGRRLFERVWTLEPEELVKLIDRAVLACAPASLAAWDTPEGRFARVTDPMHCVRAGALKELVATHDAAMDAKLFELARKTERDEVARDVMSAMAADATPARAEATRKLLAAPTDVVRQQAAAVVAAQKGRESFDVLLAAYAKETHAETKAVFLRALAVCGGDPAKTRETVLKAAKSGDPLVRTHAIVALAPWAKDDDVVEALRKLPANEKLTDHLREAACWTLGLCGKKELADDVRPAAEAKDETLKHIAAAAVARLGGATANDAQYMNLRWWIASLKVSLPEEAPK